MSQRYLLYFFEATLSMKAAVNMSLRKQQRPYIENKEHCRKQKKSAYKKIYTLVIYRKKW